MEIAEFYLEDHGAVVSKAWNGQEAIHQFKASDPGSIDVILMDIMMPVMDGLEATRRIRALSRSDAQSVVILAMSRTMHIRQYQPESKSRYERSSDPNPLTQKK